MTMEEEPVVFRNKGKGKAVITDDLPATDNLPWVTRT